MDSSFTNYLLLDRNSVDWTVFFMNNIERFNKLLNATSYDRYNKWVDFRSVIDTLLMTEIKELKSKRNLIIIGAGRCEDFSLKPLVKNFDNVILSDVDDSSIFNSREFSSLTEEELTKVQVLKVEYTGIENNGFFDNLENKLRNAKDFDSIELIFERGFRGLEEYRFLKSLAGKADLVYVSPIYTQLIYQQISLICARLRSEGIQEYLLKYIEHLAGENIVDVFKAFNENLRLMLRGKLVVASDIFQDYSDSSFMLDAKNNFSNERMNKICTNYFKEYGFGMGDLGLYLLNESMELLNEEWLLWPFDDNSEMIVKLSIYINK